MYFLSLCRFGSIFFSPHIFAVASKGLAYFVVVVYVDIYVDGLCFIFWGEFLYSISICFFYVESDVGRCERFSDKLP